MANGVVYVGSYDQNVYALNANTGALLWKYKTANFIESSPAVANGVVYIASNDPDDNLYALDANTGTLLWKHKKSAPSSMLLRQQWRIAWCTSAAPTTRRCMPWHAAQEPSCGSTQLVELSLVRRRLLTA